MDEKKIKVVWICSFSNKEIRERLESKASLPERVARKLLNCPGPCVNKDFAQWNTNAIKEIEKYENIEVHVIAPWPYLSAHVSHFDLRGVKYHFIKDESLTLIERLKRKLPNYYCSYKRNSHSICNLINAIRPDVIHLMGAENPSYSSSVLHYNGSVPIIVQLQTLMSTPDFMDNFPISKEEYNYRSQVERKVIMMSDFIGTPVPEFEKKIKEAIKPNAVFIPTSLAVTEEIETIDTDKTFDWVYFANGIEKAFDLVVEALGIVHKKYPSVKLNVVGGYNLNFKQKMEERLKELQCFNNVSFTGKLPLHDDVLREVSKAKYAVLPLKVDILSGTIRESMALGLPVVTTITPRTPDLNKERQTLLLSASGNHQALADNMIMLMENDSLARTMQQNGYIYIKEVLPSNADRIRKWVEYYNRIINKTL